MKAARLKLLAPDEACSASSAAMARARGLATEVAPVSLPAERGSRFTETLSKLSESEGRRTFSGGGPGDGAVGTTNVFAAAGYCGGGWTLPVGNVGEVEGSRLMTIDATEALLLLTPAKFQSQTII